MAIVNDIEGRVHELVGDFAKKAMKESGFGIAEHKKFKNELTSIPLIEHYRDKDFINPVFDMENNIIEIPRAAG